MSTGQFVAVVRLFRECGEFCGSIDGSYVAEGGELSELCAGMVARRLCDSAVSFTEMQGILRAIPNCYVAELVWARVATRRPSFKLFWLFFQWLECARGIRTSGLSYHVTVDPEVTPVVDVLVLFNGLDNLKTTEWSVRVRCGAVPLVECGKLAQLKNVVQMTYIERDVDVLHDTLTSWLTYIKSNTGAWNQLHVLNLPCVNTVRVLFDLCYYIPSLSCVRVGVAPEVVNSVPALQRCLRYIPPEQHPDEYAKVQDSIGPYPMTVSLSFQKQKPRHDDDIVWERSCYMYIVTAPLQAVAPKPVSRTIPDRKRPRLAKSRLINLSDIV